MFTLVRFHLKIIKYGIRNALHANRTYARKTNRRKEKKRKKVKTKQNDRGRIILHTSASYFVTLMYKTVDRKH